MKSFTPTDRLKAKPYRGEPVRYIQRKYDGHRILIDTRRKSPSVIARKVDNRLWPKFVGSRLEARVRLLPARCVLEAELFAEGAPATSIPTLLNNQDAALRMAVFAVPVWKGADCRQQCKPLLRSQEAALTAAGFTIPNTLTHPALYASPAPIKQPMMDKLYRTAEANKWEGYVAKLAAYAGWYKIKPQKTVDAFITDWIQSESATYGGGMKSVVVAVYDEYGEEHVLAQVGGGWKAEDKETLTRKDVIGRVIEVEYQSVAAKGKLQFPRFIRWRDDKAPEECTTDQL